jgi:hypothetical protein
MRATRDLRRQRLHLARTRGDLLAQRPHPQSPSQLPASGHTIAHHTNRDGVAERGAAPALPTRRDVARTLIGSYDALRRDVALTLVNTAKHQDAQPLYLRHTGPGRGTLRRRVLREELPPIERCPRVQACASAGRLVTCAKASAGKRSGTSGTKLGTAHLPWAFSEAAVVCVRDHPAGQQCLARVAQTQRPGKALTSLAHPGARAGYDRLPPQTAGARHTCWHGAGSGVGALDAALDDHGLPLTRDARH